MINLEEFGKLFFEFTGFKKNKYHPMVWILGTPKIGSNVSIGGFSEINANNSSIEIGDNCDIASFVSINCMDSHKKCIGIADEIERSGIVIENNVFIGSHCFVGGGVKIGHHSVVAAGTIVVGTVDIPPYSLVVGNPAKIKEGYYSKFSANDGGRSCPRK